MAHSAIAESTRTTIRIRGYDLVDELMGERDFVDLAILEMTGQFPTVEAKRMVNAIMVTVAEHGVTPSVIAARMTYYTAPEAFQGAVAAGLLGAGSVLLGAMENAGTLLANAVNQNNLTESASDADYQRVAQAVVGQAKAGDRRLPGFGHPIHTDGDPRSAKLIALAKQNGCYGPHLRLAQAIATEAQGIYTKPMPLNAAGAIAAVTVDLGYPATMAKAFALVARTAGLAAHLLEEKQQPIAKSIWASLDTSVT